MGPWEACVGGVALLVTPAVDRDIGVPLVALVDEVATEADGADEASD